MKAERLIVVRALCEVAVKCAHGLAEQRDTVALDGSVGVELHEEPVRPSSYVNVSLFPKSEALCGGRIDAGEVAVFDARDDAEFAPLPVETERALDAQQRVVGRRDDPGGRTGLVGTGLSVFAGVVEGIDRADLARTRRAGEREIGVTTCVAQDWEFVRDTAAFAIGMRVVERPIAMDESVAHVAFRIAGKQAERGKSLWGRMLS